MAVASSEPLKNANCALSAASQDKLFECHHGLISISSAFFDFSIFEFYIEICEMVVGFFEIFVGEIFCLSCGDFDGVRMHFFVVFFHCCEEISFRSSIFSQI